MPSDNVYSEQRQPSPLRYTWGLFYRDTTAMVGFYAFIALLLLCLAGGLLAPYGIDQQFLGFQLLPPSWSHYGDVSFFLGTDDLGRDLLSRLLSGAAPTVGSAMLVTLAAAICAMLLGVLAGLTRGLRSAVLNHILDTLLSIPSLLLAIIVVAFLGPRLEHALLAVFLALLITEFTRALSMAILDIAALGFLDLGAQLPSPEWGAMLGDSLELIYVAPWTVMLPGAAIMLSVLIVNLLGDGIRRAIVAGVE